MKSAKCFFCGELIEFELRVGRLEDCPKCGKYLHTCIQCRFYDRGYHNDCRESQAPLVGDKESANFCEFFEMGRDGNKEQNVRDDAKRKLEALFSKK